MRPRQVLQAPELGIAMHVWQEGGRKVLRLRIYPGGYSWRQRLESIWHICRAQKKIGAELTFPDRDLYLFRHFWHELDFCPPPRYRCPPKVQATVARDANGRAYMHLQVDQPLNFWKRLVLIGQVFQGILPPLGDVLRPLRTYLLNEDHTP